MTKAAAGEADGQGRSAERSELRVRLQVDSSEGQLREANRRVMARGWGPGAIPSWFRWLSCELVGVLRAKEKLERRSPGLPLGVVELTLLAPPPEIIPHITAELRAAMRDCDAGVELLRALIVALEVGPRES